jgi:predicted amidophosphoribosyltransferase
MQSLLRVVYPPQCALCDALVEEEGGLCGPCWREVPFLFGLVCDLCGAPLPGEAGADPVHCDDCLTLARPWRQGRAAMLYQGKARRLVLALKHGDRLDLAAPAARWLEGAAQPLIAPGRLVVPVPGHWRRTLRRRYNQAAVLATALARRTGLPLEVQALTRARPTEIQDGKSRAARFANLDGAIVPHPRHGTALDGASVLLVDDVMTSGATFAAAAEAAVRGGAAAVRTLALARVVKDP